MSDEPELVEAGLRVRRDPLPDSREFDSLKHIADTARSEDWPTGKALVTARVFMRRSRAEGSQTRQVSREEEMTDGY